MPRELSGTRGRGYRFTLARGAVGIVSFFGHETSRGLLLEHELAAMRLEDAFLLHLAELVGKRGAVDAQVVRELLPVEGDRERVAPPPDRLGRKVREQLSADGLG